MGIEEGPSREEMMGNKEKEQMTPEQVVTLMSSSESEDEWDKNCDKVKENYEGKYPDFWYETIIAPGIITKTETDNHWKTQGNANISIKSY